MNIGIKIEVIIMNVIEGKIMMLLKKLKILLLMNIQKILLMNLMGVKIVVLFVQKILIQVFIFQIIVNVIKDIFLILMVFVKVFVLEMKNIE